MDWYLALGVASGIVQIISIIPYVRDMIRGSTRPNVVSWSIWTILQIIALAAQWSSGASWSIIILAVMTFNTSLVVALGLWGYGYRKYGRIDISCLALALLAIVLWYFTKEPLVALVLAVVADGIAAVPTVLKTYREPHSEIPIAWFLVAAAAVLSLLSTRIFDVANIIYPIYLIVVNGGIGLLAYTGQRARLS